jgi:putative hemin transport protein
MTMPSAAAPETSATGAARTLAQRWLEFRQDHPHTRIRDAARELGVSEAELVATGCGDTAVRLAGPWGKLLEAAPTLGRIMALTRNDHVVHERHGAFQDVSVSGMMGLVLGPDIDLRLFLNRWKAGFAVTEPGARGKRQSLQFFDASGRAVHKIYAIEATDRAAWNAIVQRHRSPDQSPGEAVEPVPAPAVDRPDGAIDVEAMRVSWRELKDTHDFFGMLRQHKVGRLQAFRLAGPEFVEPMALDSGRVMLERAAASGLPIMVFVGSPGGIQIHTGPVTQLKTVGSWFNVLDPEFNLHMRETGVASAWICRKPTVDGTVTSLELFDERGEVMVMFFGKRKPGEAESEDWRRLAAALPRRA